LNALLRAESGVRPEMQMHNPHAMAGIYAHGNDHSFERRLRRRRRQSISAVRETPRTLGTHTCCAPAGSA
jgi:hypothetical protein